ncbi:hypothetical protein GGU11DRAFT_744468 [Lentinula aff. detonsa]|uniref:Phytanoyl-CoA dioxygenase family protein n=1 Tax=Lentinula aff. detonsa TaxID=2804958 RepID=A0AA38KM05_9AGAR|nr:hypothetical protein GGU10DRAFT_408459 [Lentinula aff. detonsa]KAJ3798228.1 hypothetical protein GGU11DRAFT_744468 [Lentinula aff. detonsa]
MQIPVPLESGQSLVFGSYLAHRPALNQSDNGRAAIYTTYNSISDGGDKHEAYYQDRRRLWPPIAERLPGERYDAKLYGFGTPMLSVVEEGYKNTGV